MIEPLVGELPDGAKATYEPWIFVDDPEQHLARARAKGATIAEQLEHTGFTSYVALDCEGRRWRFAQARPTQPA
jgi:uncharacterized glyoxalase superfamily protein PhnB